jgi:hypothetical protein
MIYLKYGGRRPFEFEIEYELGDKEDPEMVSIKTVSDENQIASRKVKIGKDAEFQETTATLEDRYCPSIVVYSTGNEAEWQRMFDGATGEPGDTNVTEDILNDAIQRNIIELPGFMVDAPETPDDQGDPPFWLIRSARLSTFTLCGLLAHLVSEHKPLTDVLRAINIRAVAGFSLRPCQLHSARVLI